MSNDKIPNPLTARLSVSKCKTFSGCKKQFKFNYILKLPQKDRDYLTFGKFLHKVLEDFHTAYINKSEEPFNKEMATAFKNALKEYKLSDDHKKEGYEIIDCYLKLLSEKPEKIKNIICVEKVFSVPIIENVLLNGMIDRVELDDDGILHVSDYKTTKNEKYLVNDFMQLMTYAYIMCLEDPNLNKVRVSYILLRHNFKYITKEFNREEILTVHKEFVDYAEKIDKETEWQANPTFLCRFCSYFDICEEGKSFSKPKIGKCGPVQWY